MKERPILFSAPMVRAILAGLKTQTRRIVKPQPTDDVEGSGSWYWFKGLKSERFSCYGWPENFAEACPYGQPGDNLWVRETFYYDQLSFSNGGPLPKEKPAKADENLYYSADGKCCQIIPECACAEVGKPKFRPSIHMPRWASRIDLEITKIRVERLQDISEEDAKAEGVTLGEDRSHVFAEHGLKYTPYKDAFEALWISINGRDSWVQNPWVWVIEFTPINTPS